VFVVTVTDPEKEVRSRLVESVILTPVKELEV
jgi:hypothetical protein